MEAARCGVSATTLQMTTSDNMHSFNKHGTIPNETKQNNCTMRAKLPDASANGASAAAAGEDQLSIDELRATRIGSLARPDAKVHRVLSPRDFFKPLEAFGRCCCCCGGCELFGRSADSSASGTSFRFLLPRARQEQVNSSVCSGNKQAQSSGSTLLQSASLQIARSSLAACASWAEPTSKLLRQMSRGATSAANQWAKLKNSRDATANICRFLKPGSSFQFGSFVCCGLV